MKTFVALTDFDWYKYLRALPDLDEVNFWQPSGRTQFRALDPGEPFLFKLHSPRNYIVGGGFFFRSIILPASIAWDMFGEKNGAGSLLEKRRRIEKYRKLPPTTEDYEIGCIILTQPFFFKENEWITAPSDWKPSIQRGKLYDVTTGIGKELWEAAQLRLRGRADLLSVSKVAEQRDRYGKPIPVKPRLGQGSFRAFVIEVYLRRCAVTQEKTLPVLEAAHIKPYVESGPHDIGNGILIRADIHHLLDHGYATISPDYHFEVSRRIKGDFDNGEEYFKMHGSRLYVPAHKDLRPAPEFITWHNENVYLG